MLLLCCVRCCCSLSFVVALLLLCCCIVVVVVVRCCCCVRSVPVTLLRLAVHCCAVYSSVRSPVDFVVSLLVGALLFCQRRRRRWRRRSRDGCQFVCQSLAEQPPSQVAATGLVGALEAFCAAAWTFISRRHSDHQHSSPPAFASLRTPHKAKKTGHGGVSGVNPEPGACLLRKGLSEPPAQPTNSPHEKECRRCVLAVLAFSLVFLHGVPLQCVHRSRPARLLFHVTLTFALLSVGIAWS